MKAMIGLGLRVFCLALVLGAMAAPAQAGYLTIDGKPSLDIELLDEQVRLAGAYKITNNGDERANGVFPSFRLGSWAWVGEPRVLDPKQQTEWTLDELIPLSKLGCAGDASCAKQELPTTGGFPLLVLRHYQDVNGYKFSAADIIPVTVGELSGEQQVAVRTPALQAKTSISGDGESFVGRVELQGGGAKPITVSASVHAPRELQIQSPPQTLQVLPGRGAVFEYALRNFTGLPGSGYAVFAVFQWEDSGIRTFLPVAQVAKVAKPDNTNQYIAAIVVVVLISILLLYFVVLRKKSAA